MATAQLAISPRPEHVRIARMMSVALARRGGLPEELLQEVRLAVGEAATRAVAVHRTARDESPVRFAFTEDDRGYEVRVHDAGSVDAVRDTFDLDLTAADDPDTELPPELELALVRGMADTLEVAADPSGGTLVTFRWHR